MADGNGEHDAIRQDLREQAVTLARMEQKLDGLPCIERDKRFGKLEGRVVTLESGANYARGAASAVKIIWSVVIVGLLSVAGIVMQIARLVQGR